MCVHASKKERKKDRDLTKRIPTQGPHHIFDTTNEKEEKKQKRRFVVLIPQDEKEGAVGKAQTKQTIRVAV